MAPIYDFKALSPTGKSEKGIVEADSAKSARQKLRKQNLIVTEIHEKNVSKSSSNSSGGSLFASRASAKDISLLTRQLASLIKANIPLVEALNAMVEQTEKETLKVVLSNVRDDVNQGSSLAKALAQHQRVFDSIFINMVEAGESSGTLGLVLLRLADLKEAQMRLRSKIISGMTYPVLMMGVAGVLVLGIFTFVIPKLTKIFDSMNKPIPILTRILMEMSDFILSWWYLILIAGLIGLRFFLKFINSEAGRPKWDTFKLKLPLFGNLIRMIAVTRFSTTMSTLLGSGVPILSSMSIAKNLVGNIPIARAIENARENITEGQSIAVPLKKSGQFPALVIHMISIGEKTGELPDMLRNIAETYEEQVNSRIEGMTALIEPILIVGMGIMVGVIVMAIFIPLLDISSIN